MVVILSLLEWRVILAPEATWKNEFCALDVLVIQGGAASTQPFDGDTTARSRVMIFDKSTRIKQAVSLVPRFASSLDALVPQQISDAEKPYSGIQEYTKLEILETFLFALIMQDIGWISYEVFGKARQKRPVSGLRWSSSPEVVSLEYHTDFADGSQKDKSIAIVCLSEEAFALQDDYGWKRIGIIYMMLTDYGMSGDEPVRYFLEYAGVSDVLKEARRRGIRDD
jgi:hypothetical protein